MNRDRTVGNSCWAWQLNDSRLRVVGVTETGIMQGTEERSGRANKLESAMTESLRCCCGGGSQRCDSDIEH